MESGESSEISEVLTKRIILIREHRVLFDTDPAALYGVRRSN